MALQAEAQIADESDHKIVPLESCSNMVDLSNCGHTIPVSKREETMMMTMMTNLGPKGSVTSKSLCSRTNSRGSFDSDENDVSETDTIATPLSKIINPKIEMPFDIGPVGTIFRLLFLGSVEVDEEGGRKRRKRLKKSMVEEAVNKIKVCFSVN